MKNSFRIMAEKAFMACLLFGIVGTADSRMNRFVNNVRDVPSISSFERELNNNRFVVALFFEQEIHGSLLEPISNTALYRQGGLSFVRIDLAKKRLATLTDSYGIEKVPSVLLFKDGASLKARLGGSHLSEEKIRNFINENLGSELHRVVEQLQKDRRERERNRVVIEPYMGFGWGPPYWGYPYYGWGSGYYPFGGWGGGWRGGYRGRHR